MSEANPDKRRNPVTKTQEIRALGSVFIDYGEHLQSLIHREELPPDQKIQLETLLEEQQRIILPNEYSEENQRVLLAWVTRLQLELDKYQTRHRQVINWIEISVTHPGVVQFASFMPYKNRIEYLFSELRRQGVVLRAQERTLIQESIAQIHDTTTASDLEAQMKSLSDILEHTYEFHKKYPNVEFDTNTGVLQVFSPEGVLLLQETSEFFKKCTLTAAPYTTNKLFFDIEGKTDKIEVTIEWPEATPESPTMKVVADKRHTVYEGPLTTLPPTSSEDPSIKNSLTEAIEHYKAYIREQNSPDDDSGFEASWEAAGGNLGKSDTEPTSGIDLKAKQDTPYAEGDPRLKRKSKIEKAFENLQKVEQAIHPDQWKTDSEITNIYNAYEHDKNVLEKALKKVNFPGGPYLVTLRIDNPIFNLKLTQEEIDLLPLAQAAFYQRNKTTERLTYFRKAVSTSTEISLSVPEGTPPNTNPTLEVYIKYGRFDSTTGVGEPILGKLAIDQANTTPEQDPEQFWALDKSSYTLERKYALLFLETGWLEFDNNPSLEWIEQNATFHANEAPCISIVTIPLSKGQEKKFIIFQKDLFLPPKDGPIMKAIEKLQGRLEHFLLKTTIQEKNTPPEYKLISIDAKKSLVPLEEENPEIGNHEIFLLANGWSETPLATIQNWLQADNYFSLKNRFNYLDVLHVQYDGITKFYIKFNKFNIGIGDTKKRLQEYNAQVNYIQYPLLKTYQNPFEAYSTVPDYQSKDFLLQKNIYRSLGEYAFALCSREIYDTWMTPEPPENKPYITQCFTLWEKTCVTIVRVPNPTLPNEEWIFVRLDKDPSNPFIPEELRVESYTVEQYTITKQDGLVETSPKEVRAIPSLLKGKESLYEQLRSDEKIFFDILNGIYRKEGATKANEYIFEYANTLPTTYTLSSEFLDMLSEIGLIHLDLVFPRKIFNRIKEYLAEKRQVVDTPPSQSWWKKKTTWLAGAALAGLTSAQALTLPTLKRKIGNTADKIGDAVTSLERANRVISQTFPSRHQKPIPLEPVILKIDAKFPKAPEKIPAVVSASPAIGPTTTINLQLPPDAMSSAAPALPRDAGVPDATTYTTTLSQPDVGQKTVNKPSPPPETKDMKVIDAPKEYWLTIGKEGNAISTVVINDILSRYRLKVEPTKTELKEFDKNVRKGVGRFVIKNSIPWNVFNGDQVKYDYTINDDQSITIESIAYKNKKTGEIKEFITPTTPPRPAISPLPEVPLAPLIENETEKITVSLDSGRTFDVGEVVEYLPFGTQPKKYEVVGLSPDKEKLLLRNPDKPERPMIPVEVEDINKRIPPKENKKYTIDGLWIEELLGDGYNVRFSTASGKGVIKALATLIFEKEYNNEKGKWAFALLEANKAVARANTDRHIIDTYDLVEYSKIPNLVFSTDSFVTKKEDGKWIIESAHFSQEKAKKIE